MHVTKDPEKKKILIIRGDLNSYSGYSHATRLYLSWLEDNFDLIVGVDIHAHPARHEHVWIYPLVDDRCVFDIVLSDSVSAFVLTISTPNNFRKFPGARNVGLFFWETTRLGNIEWVSALNEMDEVWVPAEFMKPMLVNEGVTKPIVYSPCPMPEESVVSERLTIPDIVLREVPVQRGDLPRFVSLSEIRASSELLLLSTNSFIPRKGFPVLADEWLHVVDALPQVALIVKVSSIDVTETAERLFEKVAALFLQVGRRHHRDCSRVFVCIESLPYHVMQALGQTCDGFVTLSFGEGLGLGLFENLLSGKPALCPRHTSFAEFLPKNYPYFLDTEVANFGLADPVGVNPVSAHWGVPVEGSLLKTVQTLLVDIRENRTSAAVAEAVEYFRTICRPRPLDF